jgi:hypothetical protein
MPECVVLPTEEYLAFIISMLHGGDILEKSLEEHGPAIRA